MSKKSNNAINIISWISIIAISIGTAALVIILSFMNGLTGMVKDLYNSFNPDLVISSVKGKTFTPDSLKTKKIIMLQGVRNMSYSIEENALVKYGERQTFALVKAVSPEFFSITGMEKRIEEGIPTLKGKDGNYIIPGKGIVYELGINIHNKFFPVTLYAPKRGNAASLTPEEALSEESLIPNAYFSINDEFDFKYVLVDLKVGKSLFGYNNEVSTIDLDLVEGETSENIKNDISKILGEGFRVKDRFEQNKLLFTTLQTEKLAVFLLLIFILIVATFNIIGSLIMLIAEKKHDLVTLSNLGAEIAFIRRIFIYEGLLIILTGAVAGIFLGILFCLLQDHFQLIVMSALGREIPYPVQMMWTDFASILCGVFLIGGISIVFPVRIFTKSNVLDKFRKAS